MFDYERPLFYLLIVMFYFYNDPVFTGGAPFHLAASSPPFVTYKPISDIGKPAGARTNRGASSAVPTTQTDRYSGCRGASGYRETDAKEGGEEPHHIRSICFRLGQDGTTSSLF